MLFLYNLINRPFMCLEQRTDITLLFVELDDRPIMIVHSFVVVNPSLCFRAVVQPRDDRMIYDHP